MHESIYLSKVWGIYPVVIAKPKKPFNIRDEMEKVCEVVCQRGFTNPETDLITFTAGLPWGTPGSTNLIR